MEANHVRDLMEVYSSIYAECGDENIIQERAWWDPAGVFMSKREKEVEKAKSTPTGYGASYNPNTGRTYNPNARDQSRATGVIAPRGGVMGTMEPGKPSTWQRYAPGSDPNRRQNIDRYTTVRGRDQIKQDDIRNKAAKDKARRDAAATADFDRRYGVDKPPGDEFAAARKNTRVVSQPATKPVAKPAAKPAPTPTAKPAPTPTAKPAPTPTSKPAPTPTATPSTPTTTSSSPSSQLTDLRKMRIASQMRQAGANVVSTQLASFDPFDIVMGHLLDEGYAETEQAALAIMANMGEEWRQSIISEESL